MTKNKQLRKLRLSKITTNKTVSEAVKAIDPLIWIHEERDTRGTIFKMMNIQKRIMVISLR